MMSELNLENYQHLFPNQETRKLLDNQLLNKDIWHQVDDLKLEVPEHLSKWIFNFTEIYQEQLKILAKAYILTKCKLLRSLTLNVHLTTIKKFSVFLRVNNIDNLEKIDNLIFENFDSYLCSQGLSRRTICHHYINLSSFFDTCRLEGWINVNTYWFQGRKTSISLNNKRIDYIPEEVWNQLEENLHLLPEQLQRMVLIIRTTGLRIGELVNLPLNCLRKRNEQWRLRLKETEKYQIEDELPINIPELVLVIQEQQNYIKQTFGSSYNHLFCSLYKERVMNKDEKCHLKRPVAKIMKLVSFNKWLNLLAKTANIRDSSGVVWKFSSHQFRRTIATIMTNAGIRDLIIQKYLRHRSPDMLSYYQHIMKEVLGQEYEELLKEKKYVDITGKVVDFYKPTNPITTILRQKMYQITTQYGECHRPTLKNPCPTVNSCWRCKEWRVSSEDLEYLKEDLQRVENELKIAETLGMLRQQQGLENDRNILRNYIIALENNYD